MNKETRDNGKIEPMSPLFQEQHNLIYTQMGNNDPRRSIILCSSEAPHLHFVTATSTLPEFIIARKKNSLENQTFQTLRLRRLYIQVYIYNMCIREKNFIIVYKRVICIYIRTTHNDDVVAASASRGLTLLLGAAV